MKTYAIISACFYLLLFSSCSKEESDEPPFSGEIYISFENKDGKNLLENIKTSIVDSDIILRQDTYEYDFIMNGILKEYNPYLFIRNNLVTGDKESIRFGYTFYLSKIPQEGTFQYNFMSEDIFGNNQYYSIIAKYEKQRPNNLAVKEFHIEDENITVELISKDEGVYPRVYHILLTLNDSK